MEVFHLRCLRRILGISWKDRISNKTVLDKAEKSNIHALLSQRLLRWLGHVRRMQDGRIPKDILYGEQWVGTRPVGRPFLRYKDMCKHDLKNTQINTEHWEGGAANRDVSAAIFYYLIPIVFVLCSLSH